MTRAPKSPPPNGRRDFLAGQLLIAMPNMADPRFERSVVLMCAHDERHAMGVIVNKPLVDVELGELLEQLDIDPREGVGGDPVLFGGPVQTDRGVVLHSLDYRNDTTMEIGAGIGLTASRDILVDIGGRTGAKRPDRYLLALGHAGWGAGQLESEIAQNAWAHCAADSALVFSDHRDTIWRMALERLGVTAATLTKEWFSARPGNAPLN
jgi:putative transcriptional regulator